MKLLFLLFLVCSIQSLVWSDVEPDFQKPQTVRIPLGANVKIVNEKKGHKKVLNKHLFLAKVFVTKTKKPNNASYKNYTVFPEKKEDVHYNGYTVFPPATKDEKGIPESNFFRTFQKDEMVRTRVKKALPPVALARSKRSANAQHSKSRGHHSKKRSNVGRNKKFEKRRPVHEKGDLNTRRSHHKKSHKKHKRHGKKHHRSKKGKGRRSGKAPGKKGIAQKNQRSRSLKANSFRNDTRRLYQATDGFIEDYPYVVSIQKDYQHWCSGALLNPRIVLTTANCMWRSSGLSKMHVRAGSRYSNTGGQRAHILQVYKHPAWSIRSSPDNDVAMLLLDRDIKFSNKVHGADIPNIFMQPPFDDVWVTSWGAVRRDGVYDPDRNELQVYHARLMSLEKCNNQTKRFGVTVSENFFCVAQTGRRAPCTRDTGAPAVSDGVIWGLASWGLRKLCGTERFPAMFSYLGSPSNHDFLINATRILMSDMREDPFLDHLPTRGPLVIPTTTTPPFFRREREEEKTDR